MEFKPDGGLMKSFIELLNIGVQYIGFIIVALLGGTVNYIGQVKDKKRVFSVIELIGEWFLSGFSALMIALLCEEYGISWNLTVVACGIAGHMGGKVMFILEIAITRYFTKKFPSVFEQPCDRRKDDEGGNNP